MTKIIEYVHEIQLIICNYIVQIYATVIFQSYLADYYSCS